MRPDYAEALTNRGITLLELKRFKEALASFDRALKVRPDFAEAHCSRALSACLLATFMVAGKTTNGDGKPNTWEKKGGISHSRYGSDLTMLLAKTILLHGEQGFGDVIQFCRYVPLVAERAARVILEVPEPCRS